MGSSYTPTLNKRHDFSLGFARCKPDFFLAVNRGNLSPLHFLGKNASFLLYSFVKYNIFMGSSYTPTLNKRHDFSLGFAQCKPDFFLAVNRENLSPLHFLWQECILLTIFLCKIQYFFMGSSYTPTPNKRHDFFPGFAQCKPDFFLATIADIYHHYT